MNKNCRRSQSSLLCSHHHHRMSCDNQATAFIFRPTHPQPLVLLIFFFFVLLQFVTHPPPPQQPSCPHSTHSVQQWPPTASRSLPATPTSSWPSSLLGKTRSSTPCTFLLPPTLPLTHKFWHGGKIRFDSDSAEGESIYNSCSECKRRG